MKALALCSGFVLKYLGSVRHSALGMTALLAWPVHADNSLEASALRMEGRIQTLSHYGRNADGGVNRVAYSDADIAGRMYIMNEMRNLGLDVSIDPAGNMIGKRPGSEPTLPPIALGSHIDSVPGGGNYDGDVGVIGALEVVSMLNESGVNTRHPLEVIVFSDEEGSMVGSLAMSGQSVTETLNNLSHSGYTVSDGLDRIGGDHDRTVDAARKQPLHAFLELHIEQGGLLEQKALEIGVVEGIVGIKWWQVTAHGVANHGGTTPMPGRKDALVAASRLITAINSKATTMEGRQVATVGKIQAFPGAPNVIPGRVEFALEIRDLESEKIDRVLAMARAEADRIAADMDVSFDFSSAKVDLKPAPTDLAVRNLIADAAEELGFTWQFMPSGAGHDSQNMATITPTGMIFVPSRNGISHSPQEFTAPIDMARGAHVLLRTILKLDDHRFENK